MPASKHPTCKTLPLDFCWFLWI